MRLATFLPDNRDSPIAGVSVDAQNWVPLHQFLTFLGVKNLPAEADAPLADFLPVLMPCLSELTRKVDDWPEHGRIFQQRGGKTLSARKFLPPILRPPSFREFNASEEHVKAVRARDGLDMIKAWYERPAFYFSNPNCLIGHDTDVFGPADSNELDYELEVGIVIGNRARNISPETAWKHVAGFTIINDFSARDLQRMEMAVGLGPSKGKDFATAMGPVLVTRDEFADKIDNERVSLQVRARRNGRELSRGYSGALFYTFPQMVAHASRNADLFPGDLISSGTIGTGCILALGPENTGGWLKPGDVIELEIERIGVLRSRVAARKQ